MNETMNEVRFEQDLRSVLHALAGSEAPASLRYRLADVTAAPSAPRLSWFASPPMRLAAAAVAVVAVLALAVLFVPRQDVGPLPTFSPTPTASQPATPEPSPSASPSTTPAPTPTPVPTWASMTWQEPIALPGSMTFLDVTAWEGGYVGVGQVNVGSESIEAGFFRSVDGLSWTIAHQEQVDAERWPRLIVRHGDGLLAFSNRASSPLLAAFDPPLVWASLDGVSWTRLDSESWNAETAGFTLYSVAAGRDGIVAIGGAWKELATGETSHVSLVLHSVDGRRWVSAQLPPATASQCPSHVETLPAGGFAMVGSLACELHSERGLAAAWFSEDGIDWEAALMPAVESDDGKFTTLLVAGGGLLAHTQPVDPPIGAGPTGRWWLSTDARTWRPAEDDGIDVPAGGFALGDGEHIVVLATDAGWSPMIGDPYPGLTRAWLSSDGASWAELAVSGTMPERSVQGIWLGQNGVIAIGAEQSWFAAADVP